uniref:DNA 3'-5' helicase n=1 Tax=Saccoglossus kowalevskii TaxID=10224 RepID=A0ABM0MF70_SACKO|nr:PREDICTED: probable ATP-dependent DNA helicase HFM1-like [Saccoglossus kowalevskii]
MDDDIFFDLYEEEQQTPIFEFSSKRTDLMGPPPCVDDLILPSQRSITSTQVDKLFSSDSIFSNSQDFYSVKSNSQRPSTPTLFDDEPDDSILSPSTDSLRKQLFPDTPKTVHHETLNSSAGFRKRSLFKPPLRPNNIPQYSGSSQGSLSTQPTNNSSNRKDAIHAGSDHSVKKPDFSWSRHQHSSTLGISDSPHPLTIPGFVTPGGSKGEVTKLRPVTEIPEKYRSVFSEYPYFNIVQSKVMDDVLYSDKPLVVCAPTGSGKTVIFELAIIRLMIQMGSYAANDEKWDSMTRKWRDNKSLVQMVRLFLIDEVHTLNDEARGATMEAVISRMKTIQTALKENQSLAKHSKLRFLAISATITNICDIGEWLGEVSEPAVMHKMDDTHRPVRLRKVVLGFPCHENQSEFKFDLSLNYKLSGVIQTYSDQKPTLVFCATRKGVQQAASTLVKDARFIMNSQHRQRLQKYSNMLKDSKLRDLVVCGVGYHHAGLDISDRKTIESMFTKGDLPVLLATSTLAMGVNLPAHLVVVKSTQHYVTGMYCEYSETQVLQMIGRAGRPQFDTTATAVIMTRFNTKKKYEALLNGTQNIESSLHLHIMEHLNAEIVLNTITDMNIALEWLKSTFLYIRVVKNPTYYGIPPGLSKEALENKLKDMCSKYINSLKEIDLVTMEDDNLVLTSTELGKLMARYCIAYDTMKLFTKISGPTSLSELVNNVSNCKEFRDIQLRVSEKRALNALNSSKNKATIRFPMVGKIKTAAMKVNCLIQAAFGCLPVQDFALAQDTNKIFRAGQRVTRCLTEYFMQKSDFHAAVNSVLLSKCFKAKLWENSGYIARQLEKVGPTLTQAMVNAGLTTFKSIEETNPREIELIVNRHPPFGNLIHEAVKTLPKYDAVITQGDTILCKNGTWSKRIEVQRAKKGEEIFVHLISQDLVGLDVQKTFKPVYLGQYMKGVDCKQEKLLKKDISSATRPKSQDEQTGRIPCSHRCINKDVCGHECCKYGVKSNRINRSLKPMVAVEPCKGSHVQGHISQLHSKVQQIPNAPPLKRLKLEKVSPDKPEQDSYLSNSYYNNKEYLQYLGCNDSDWEDNDDIEILKNTLLDEVPICDEYTVDDVDYDQIEDDLDNIVNHPKDFSTASQYFSAQNNSNQYTSYSNIPTKSSLLYKLTPTSRCQQQSYTPGISKPSTAVINKGHRNFQFSPSKPLPPYELKNQKQPPKYTIYTQPDRILNQSNEEMIEYGSKADQNTITTNLRNKFSFKKVKNVSFNPANYSEHK